MALVERVYIGGFEAGRLSGTEIVSRLKSQLASAIDIRDEDRIHFGTCFCHVNVVSKKDGASALDSIVKLYHNVKWKGCKLKVEKARPHLLERLEAERQERKTKAAAGPVATVACPETALPRFLKIKQRHGQECWKVDTRPVEVDDWKRFEKLRTKLTTTKKPKQEQKKVRVVVSNTSRKSKPAIHFTFASDIAEAAMDESGSDSSSSDSAASDAEAKGGDYQWSDDESSSSSSTSVADEAVAPHWPLKETSMLDEFAPAMDESSPLVLEESDDDSSTSSGSKGGDLAGEVERGLNVLSELFPDVDKTAHAVVKESDDKSLTSGSVATKANVLMERYDPSLASAEQYVLPVNADKEIPTEPVAVSAVEPEPHHTPPVQESSGVYEEKKLEAVFRDARTLPVVAATADFHKNSGTFSFGFQMEESTEKHEAGIPANASTFEFSFSVNDGANPASNDAPVADTNQVDDTLEESSSSDRDTKRRRTFFTNDELSSYVEDFFLMGDGPKIRDDLERYRADEQIHERWMQERKALTLDWKRKRKHAASRQKNRQT